MFDKDIILTFQKNEITEFYIYNKLAKFANKKNSKLLTHLANDERRHYGLWKKISKKSIKPNKLKIFWYVFLARVFGLTFAIKLMENGEQNAEIAYSYALKKYKIARKILKDERKHETALVNMIDEEKVKHIGSMVLGINDALVEITGTLAGLTFALQNSALVGLAGLITGIAATLSMGASEYLSQNSEGKENPLKAAIYTAFAYLFAVCFLVGPFFIFNNVFTALSVAVFDAILVIAIFTWFTSVVKDTQFKHAFIEMVTISVSVATISFFIGVLARVFLKVEV